MNMTSIERNKRGLKKTKTVEKEVRGYAVRTRPANPGFEDIIR